MADEFIAIGQRLVSLRKSQDLNAAQVARQIGLTRQTVSLWEKGKINFSAVVLFKLAKVLRASPEYIMLGEHKKSSTGVDLELLERAARISIEEARVINFGADPALMAKIIATVYERALNGGDDDQLHNTGADVITFEKLSE